MRIKEVACEHKNFEIITREETYPVYGEETTILANVKVCKDCGRSIFDYKLDDENLKKAFVKYKKNHSLLTSSEIVSLRKKYGISQRTLAVLIGCSQATIVRYEKGDIQDNTHNNILRMLLNPQNMGELIDVKEDEIGEKEALSIRKKIAIMENTDQKQLVPFDMLGAYLNIKADQYSGFREFDFNKFNEMVVFFADNNSILYKTKLLKLLWYADMLYFQQYTTSISGMNYVHQHYGPVPKEYNLLLGLMERSGSINVEEVYSSYGVGEIIETNMGDAIGQYLIDDEIAVLKQVIEKYGNLSAGAISKRTHEEAAYKETGEMERISYKYAMEII